MKSFFIFLMSVCLCSSSAFAVPVTEMSQSGQKQYSNVLTMEQTIIQGLSDNQDLKSWREKRDAAKYGKRSRLGAMGPKASISYSVFRDREAKAYTYVGANKVGSTTAWGFNFKVQQPIFAGFALLSSYQKASLQSDQAIAQVNNAELGFITMTQQEFIALLVAREQVKSAEKSKARLKEQLRVSSAYYKTGLKPKFDVLQAQADLGGAEDVLLKARNAVDVQEAKLNSLLNKPSSFQGNYQGSLVYFPFNINLDECYNYAWKNRPDIYIAKKAIEVSGKDVIIARSKFFPQVSGVFSYSRYGDGPSVDGGKGYSKDTEKDWNAGITADWSIFNSGEDYYAAKQAKSLEQSVVSDLNNLLADVSYQIKSNFLTIQEGKKRIEAARQTLSASQESYRMAQMRYKEQVGTINDVLTAQSTLASSELNLAQVLGEYESSMSKLYYSIGMRKISLR